MESKLMRALRQYGYILNPFITLIVIGVFSKSKAQKLCKENTSWYMTKNSSNGWTVYKKEVDYYEVLLNGECIGGYTPEELPKLIQLKKYLIESSWNTYIDYNCYALKA